MSGAIVLIGLSGSGKSTIGKELAGSLALPFRDTDRLIEARAGRTIAQIFAAEGEERFRALEAEVIAGACRERAVVATGGGAVLRERNRIAMREGNLVIWLDPPLTLLAQRLAAHQTGEVRPLLQGDLLARLEQLRGERCHLYAAAAHRRVGHEPQARAGSRQVAAKIKSLYRAWIARETT
ncbi:MAG TPA: shikimate kinase [Chloroflexota bacterium]|nr:shikimate kinase [Chloroflexota bacterium]